jgi:glutathione S-transferase
MKLYWSPASPYARKVRALARQKDLAASIEEIVVDPYADTPDLVAANALGKVPALITDDGFALFDSPVICEFLDSMPAATGPRLIPASGRERWTVRRAEALADGLMDLGLGLTLERRKPEGEHSPTAAARWRRQVGQAVDAMARDVAGLPPWPTLGHIAGAVALGYLDFRHPDIAWRDGRGTLADWYADVAARPSLAATAPK